jgi:hypothetical protein
MHTQHQMADAIRTATAFRPGGVTDYRTAYLSLDAGQSWPFMRGSETITNRALNGWLIAVAACACWAAILMATGGTRPMDATAQMERLARQLERTTAIPSQTANELARVIGQPGYDCRQVACSAELEQRNLVARTRLEQLLAAAQPSDEFSPTTRRRSASIEVAP